MIGFIAFLHFNAHQAVNQFQTFSSFADSITTKPFGASMGHEAYTKDGKGVCFPSFQIPVCLPLRGRVTSCQASSWSNPDL